MIALVLTGLTAAVSSAVISPVARASSDFTGFFVERNLSQAGWSTCAPVTWSADVSGMTSRQARAEVRGLKRAWRAWSEVSGITTEFVGRERLAFDPATNGLRPVAGSPRSDRHIYVAFKTRSQVPIMASNAVGLAMPTVVMMPTQEIVAGMAIFRRGYVTAQRSLVPDRVQHLYLHEFGHILGLGHAQGADNIMHPTLNESTDLGDGDRAGIARLTQACLTP